MPLQFLLLVVCSYTVAFSRLRNWKNKQSKEGWAITPTFFQHNSQAFVFYPVQTDLNISLAPAAPVWASLSPISINNFHKRTHELQHLFLETTRRQDDGKDETLFSFDEAWSLVRDFCFIKTISRRVFSPRKAWGSAVLCGMLSSCWPVKQRFGSKEMKSSYPRTLRAPRSKTGKRLSFQDNHLLLSETRDGTLLLPCFTALVKMWRNLPLNTVSFLFSRKLYITQKCCIRSPPRISELLKKACVIICFLNFQGALPLLFYFILYRDRFPS